MTKSLVANRYALALYKAANEQGVVEAIQQELVELKKAFETNREIEEILQTPRLSNAKKKDIMGLLLDGAHQLVKNAVFVLLDKKRIDEIKNFVDEYISIANDAAGIADATVYSTYPLTDSEKANISVNFAQMIGKQSLRIDNIIDKSLIGGIRVQIGNQIIDSSLSGKLNRLKKDLIGS